MKRFVHRVAVLLLAVLLLCLWAVPAAFAEAAAEPAETAEPQETAQPTERPKVSAEELQDQGILTVGAKGEEVSKLQQRLKDLGYLSSKVDGKYGGGKQYDQ